MRDIEDYTQKYVGANFERYQAKYRRKKVLEILEQYKPTSVLEIGCGTEPLFSYADWDYQSWTIVEPSSAFYDNAKKLVERKKKSNHIFLYNELFPTESVKNRYFDFIICSSLLHEVEDSEAFLKEIKDICRTDTILYINVPNANSLHRIIAKGMKLVDDVHEFSDRNKELQQHKVFDEELLKKEIEDAGFFVFDSGSFFLKPFTHLQMYKMIENNIIGEDVLDGLYNIPGGYGSEIYVNARLAQERK